MCQVEEMEMGESPVKQNIIKETEFERDCCVIGKGLSYSSSITWSGK